MIEARNIRDRLNRGRSMHQHNDPTTQARLELEHDRLTNELSALRAELGVTAVGSTLPAFERDGQDDVDMASETVDREVSRSIELDLQSQLDEIAAAQRRLRAGHYGDCLTCHQPIGVARLDALPWTPWCVEHAAIVEYRSEARADPEEPAFLLGRSRTSDDEDGVDPDEGSAEVRAMHLE